MINFKDLCDRVGKTPDEVRNIIRGKFRFTEDGTIEAVLDETATNETNKPYKIGNFEQGFIPNEKGEINGK